ncbi:MAG: right-handed parallel beta-helix repeat-containing protein, partial [Gammaproteobacteria bacterium]|nr:right-handed parallel beta-helix repeat-containing protein [Gammaproteobacteria bacterium]
ISVVCINAYSVGGTVTGLVGTGLVVQNNGTDNLEITADGNFIFATAMANGSNYNVSILTQPDSSFCKTTNATGIVNAADITSITITCTKVMPLYPTNGANWNDYVKDDGSDIVSATDTECIWSLDTACLHAGEMRVVKVTGETSCTGITASDSLTAFNWICDASTGTVRIISTGLATGYGLADLVDFTLSSWKPNSLTVYKNTIEIEVTMPAVWWENPVEENTTGGALATAGTVYLVPDNTTGVTFQLNADRVSLVAAPGVIITGPGTSDDVIFSSFMPFLWIEGMEIDATGDSTGVYLYDIKFSVLQNLVARNANTGYGSGIFLRESLYSKITDITVTNNEGGLWILSGTGHTLSNITASNSSTGGISITGSSHLISNVYTSDNSFGGISIGGSNHTVSNIYASNNAYRGVSLSLTDSTLSNINVHYSSEYGLYLNDASSNVFSGVTVGNSVIGGVRLEPASVNNIFSDVRTSNNATGISLIRVSDNIFSGVITSNNGYGIRLIDATNNVFQDITANQNSTGIFLDNNIASTENNTLTGITASNNSFAGISNEATYNTLANVTASNNDTGLFLWNSSNSYVTGVLKVGNNSTKDCSVTDSLGLVDTTCANNGTSDAALTTDITTASSFVAKITTDETMNTSDTNGAATITDIIAPFDWFGFENNYRTWGKDGGAFPDAGNQLSLGCSGIASASTYTNQADCEVNAGTWNGDARIWDWSLQAVDTVIKDALSLPTGYDVLTHTWSDISTSTFLRNAVEIKDDGNGNDNFLCETNESCLYTPNTGSYQGHGNLISAGSIGTGGTLENITLMKYETNGY